MIRSPTRIRDCLEGAEFFLCRHWDDPSCEFERVVVSGRRGSRVLVQLPGEKHGIELSCHAADLWQEKDLSWARDCRRRDLEIAGLDHEYRMDAVGRQAAQLTSLLFAGQMDYEQLGVVRGLLRRAGRPEELSALHEAAYADSERLDATVCAPEQAWEELLIAVAASGADTVDARADAAVKQHPWLRENNSRGAVLERLRSWASLAPNREEADDPSEIRRLQAIVQLAADLLDEAGRPDSALNIRKAAFPHRFDQSDTA